MKEIRIPLFNFLNFPRLEPDKLKPEERIRHFAEIYTNYSQEQAASQSSRCLDCANPYCEWKCPVHNYIPQWLRLVAEGKLLEAVELCHQTNSLPEMCGRICPQERLCEGACTLNDGLGAITIGAIEKYITDKAFEQGWRPDLSHVVNTGKRVAIVGAGPAGLSCADVLIRNGIKPVVYDRYPEIGGLLTFGIPEFKLEKKVVKTRRKILEEMGVEFHLNMEVGKDIQIEELVTQYDAVFLGLGAEKGKEANIKGDNLPGVYKAMPFLVNNIYQILGLPVKQKINFKRKHVVVFGAGDTAMDCVRSSIRKEAASVHCVYRREERDMPGARKEVKHAIEEGVNFLWYRQAVEIIGEKRVKAVKIAKTFVDDKGRLQVDHNDEELLLADAIIFAYGFDAAPPAWFQTLGIATHDNGLTKTSEQQTYPLQTTNPKIFAGGDMVLGADLVVTAVAQGRNAASGIINYLSSHNKIK